MRRDADRARQSRDWKHILKRTAIHLCTAPALYLLAWAILHSFSALPGGTWSLALPALVAFAAVSLREVFDVARGGWVWKSVIDWIGWAAGLGGTAWLVRQIAATLGAPC